MLVVDPADRLSAVDILGHPWVTVSIRQCVVMKGPLKTCESPYT